MTSKLKTSKTDELISEKKQVVYKEGIYSYVRYSAAGKLVIINNFVG